MNLRCFYLISHNQLNTVGFTHSEGSVRWPLHNHQEAILIIWKSLQAEKWFIKDVVYTVVKHM